MRILRFDSVGGASGDMILGALVGLGVDPTLLEAEISKLIPEKFRLVAGEKSSFGVTGVHLTVEIDSVESDHGSGHCHVADHGNDHCHADDHESGHYHIDDHEREHCRADAHGSERSRSLHRSEEHCRAHGRTYAAIRSLLTESSLEPRAKVDALAAFKALANAEAEAHGVSAEDVHFHEVGATDSIIDTVGCALGLSLLNVDGISLSPLPIGEGTFHCAHGTYPLPAPATAILLRDFSLPVSTDVERCEMLTPTAASLFAVWKKIEIPKGASVVAIANSFGTREMKTRPNLLRASLYEFDESRSFEPTGLYGVETLYELETNVDDASGERLAHSASILFDKGALDVWFEPIQMKKGRPATRVCALVREVDRVNVLEAFFRHVGVLGVRETEKRRYFLERCWREVETSYGKARVKVGSLKTGETLTVAPEYDDVVKLARETGSPFEVVYREALVAFYRS